MAGTLDEYRNRIEDGGAACRIDPWDSALVFKIEESYYVGAPHSDQAVECEDWDGVLDELGDWAEREDWQPYRLA